MATNSEAQHIIAANTKEGKASFYELPHKPKTTTLPYGSATLTYVVPSLPPDLSVDATADLAATAELSQTGLAGFNGRICPDGGMSTFVFVLNPGVVAPLHRTRTLDCIAVLEGEVELHLDDGTMRLLKKADTVTMRGVMHKWVNASDKEVKLFGIGMDASPVRDANGNELKEEFAESLV